MTGEKGALREKENGSLPLFFSHLLLLLEDEVSDVKIGVLN